ncbi:probable G-protein coupled receptor Mth-like 1 [Tribolium castaneum]|uniref:Putative G-protein coupled receptor Mth-like 1 n=1 Tax=Tribolium castaneum TaxID=7070 RepID=D6X2H9_TRICA|nr:PREDICTED: probable G-protein coupled receptor Mth-like 1 [Tribolium castaneum]EFA10672.1 putative G-protein coupled receptor Mth-like 1 [Tribolium castaneum]|eukprot:XP_966579.1 PREDICTED: probable G-protein coupled receptor Mth-like 1 [Tribolium castaneum]
MPRRVLLLLLGAFSIVHSARNVTISKCCPFTATLNNENKCIPVLTPKWTLKVFSPRNRSYLPDNQVPPNWHLKPASKPPCAMPALLTPNLGNYIPFQNGSLYVLEYDEVVHPDNFCIDYAAVLVCLKAQQPESMTAVRVKKCCGENAIFSETNKTCIHFKDAGYKIDVGSDKKLTAGFPTCDHQEVVITEMLREAEMHKNGSLWLPKMKVLLPAANYCLENILEDAGHSPKIMICQEHVTVEKAESHDIRFIIYPISLALSAVFLAATLAAGAILPASHHVLHWRCQTNHVACLLVGNVLLCITQLSGRMDATLCFSIAVSMHFLFLAAFFWLNTMCFNIWWTFRDLRPQSVEKSQEWYRLRLYELYAWGVPVVIAGTAAILDQVADSSNFLRPKFGDNTCWFHGNLEKLTFFYGPIGTLLLINLALFALTARELTCGLWKRELVKSTSERAALGRVCIKLVVVMGVSWIAEIISWMVGGPQELWYLTDLINCFQGVFIFIVVGCQPQVLSAVKRLWCLRKHRANGTAGTTNHHSSSSQGMPSMGDTVTNHSVTNNTTKSVPLETSC